ncbi:hypothetical protein K788_0005881 [Paraburkholderia caribensis MBA4]|uniref:Uncharacterized protein n=1 Tax=Paraburkholderia caribensis MBA4 TaxID=1323664 RepID=A0A0P0R4A2_9BURK|nr:hypothetical protein K788_0005881 [Paraburkholderia caribensis MBA4]
MVLHDVSSGWRFQRPARRSQGARRPDQIKPGRSRGGP